MPVITINFAGYKVIYMRSFKLDLVSSLSGLEMKELLECILKHLITIQFDLWMVRLIRKDLCYQRCVISSCPAKTIRIHK